MRFLSESEIFLELGERRVRDILYIVDNVIDDSSLARIDSELRVFLDVKFILGVAAFVGEGSI